MKAAIIYWSKTGNTQKVAQTIREALEGSDVKVTYLTVQEAGELDWFDYDLVCLGFPSYSWRPPKAVGDLLSARFGAYRKEGRVKTGAPHVPGKYALIFCTYSGPHTGIDEAIPATKQAGQYFAHLGFAVLDEWHVVGEFHGSEEHSTMGPLADIRGRPNVEDLAKVRQDTVALLARVQGTP